MYVTEKIFEDVFQCYGPRWRPEQSPDQYDGSYGGILLDFMKKALESQKRVQGPKGPIFFDFIYNPSFNALATTASGHELITLFTGAASHLLSAHHCLLSDPKSLPTVGKAKNERLSSDALDLFRNCSPLQEPHHHPNGERFEVATCLVWLSCIYILLHEVGHIVWCHPSYMEQKHGLNIYEELPMISMNQRIIDISLAFEWEADEYAAISSYQLTHRLFQSGSFAPLRPLGVDFAWGLATSMVFLIIARLSKSWNRGSITHPPAFIRYVWSMMSVEGASECVALNPNTASLQAGFAEVGNWFKRNEVQISPEEEDLSTDNAVQRLKEQYDQVRAVFATENDILKKLEAYRSEKAQERLQNNNM